MAERDYEENTGIAGNPCHAHICIALDSSCGGWIAEYLFAIVSSGIHGQMELISGMAHFINTLKKPIVWIYFSVIYIWLLSLSVLVATLGPPYVLVRIARPKNTSLITDFIESFHSYVKETARTLNVSDNIVWYSFFSNIVIFPLAILTGFFVVKKKMWARNFMIVLLLILILRPLILQIVASGAVLMQADTIIESIIFLMIIFFLTRKSATAYFQRD